jgi:two-component system CheB/CheR fusion protein
MSSVSAPSFGSSTVPTVLFADDDPLFRRLAAHYFTKLPIELHEAADGQDALDAVACAELDFSLVVLDVDMPEMDGIITHRLLREHGYTGPIVALTGTDSNAMRRMCLEMGFDDYLLKPSEPDGWGQIIAQLTPYVSNIAA